MKTSTFTKIVIGAFALVAWFGFIGPWAVSSASSVLSFGWLGITGVAALYCIVKGFSKMKSGVVSALLVCSIAGMSLTGCSYEKITAGNVGVKVYLLGGKKGVENEVLGVGRYWIGWNEDLFVFPLFQQNYTWESPKKEGDPDESFTFQTKEGMVVGADVGITYHVEKAKVAELFQKYRVPVEEIRDKFVRNNVRDALNAFGSKMSIEETYGVGKTALFDSVQTKVANDLSRDGIVIDRVYLIGKFDLPQAVINALNAKIAATQEAQQRENQVQTARAQAEIEIAKANGESQATLIRAKADAEALNLKSRQISALMVEYEYAQRWDGELPEDLTITGSGTPFSMFKGKK